MNKLTAIAIFSTLILSAFSYGATEIESKQAAFYDGQNVIACGIVKEVSRFKRGFYINMDKPFPKQSLTLVAWENDIAEIQDKHGLLDNLVNKRVCAKGVINDYRGRSQISLYNSYSLLVR
ncbi:hypothetical protein [Photobacterium leiognathi]|uniref:hypothetical protein n=1 Tax=Photobacterium leiognathi TaxID=553611 RepID=UPI00076AA1DD|nr:hypothetical protein [Photobacterium leiognathi]